MLRAPSTCAFYLSPAAGMCTVLAYPGSMVWMAYATSNNDVHFRLSP